MLILTSSSIFVINHIIAHLPKPPHELKLTFIPTAAEVEKGDLQWLKDDRQTLVNAGFVVSDFSVTGKSRAEVETMLKATDVVFVAGGNTFFLLQEMRKSGFTELVTSYLDQGLTYIGSSAGSVVAGPDISLIKGLDDPALAPELNDYTGLGLIDVILLPHWGSDYFKHRYEKLIEFGYGRGHKLILLTDDQYLLVKDQTYTIESI